MSNNMIYIETDQLKACASEYDRLADQFQNDWKIIESKLKECENYWQGSFTTDMDNVMKKVKKAREDIYENTIKLSTFIKSAADLYVKYDGDIAKALQDNPSLNAADYPDNVISSVNVMTKPELEAMLNGIYHDYSSYKDGKLYRTYDGIVPGTVNCPWYTGKKAEAHGFDLSFSTKPDSFNGKHWYERIQSTDSYDAIKYEGGNCLNKMIEEEGQPITDIIISFPYAASKNVRDCGHVLYIDQIVDGTVYYSDNRNPKIESTCSLAEFLSKYPSSNGTPIGCVHLKKKH